MFITHILIILKNKYIYIYNYQCTKKLKRMIDNVTNIKTFKCMNTQYNTQCMN